MEYITLRWRQGYQGETYNSPTDPAIIELAAHEHDPSTFVEKSSGLPFLRKAASGINIDAAGIEEGTKI